MSTETTESGDSTPSRRVLVVDEAPTRKVLPIAFITELTGGVAFDTWKANADEVAPSSLLENFDVAPTADDYVQLKGGAPFFYGTDKAGVVMGHARVFLGLLARNPDAKVDLDDDCAELLFYSSAADQNATQLGAPVSRDDGANAVTRVFLQNVKQECMRRLTALTLLRFAAAYDALPRRSEILYVVNPVAISTSLAATRIIEAYGAAHSAKAGEAGTADVLTRLQDNYVEAEGAALQAFWDTLDALATSVRGLSPDAAAAAACRSELARHLQFAPFPNAVLTSAVFGLSRDSFPYHGSQRTPRTRARRLRTPLFHSATVMPMNARLVSDLDIIGDVAHERLKGWRVEVECGEYDATLGGSTV